MRAVYKNIFNQNAMKESQMDKIFKNKLEQYDSGASDALWAAIEAKRKKERRVVPWIYWLGGAALLLATGTLIWNLYFNSQESLIVEKMDMTPVVVASEEVSSIDEQEVIPVVGKQEERVVEKIIDETPSVSTIIEKEAIPNTPILVKEERVVEKSTPIIVEQEEEKVIENQIDKITTLPRLKAALLSVKEEKGPEGCYTFSGGGGQPLLDAFYFDGFAGLGYAFRKLENLDDPENDFYLTARDSTEREWYSFGTGLRGSMRYEGGLVLRAGVQYSQINEIFEITDGDATRTVTTEIRDSEGNIIGTETTIEQGELFKKTHNRLRLIDIPVMVGYEWAKDKLTLSANAGASFNLRFTQKGDVLSTKLESITIDSDNPNRLDYFKSKMGVSYIGSIGMTYQLKDNLDLLVEPQIRYYPNSVGRHTLSQRYTDVGIFTGLRYYFLNRKRN